MRIAVIHSFYRSSQVSGENNVVRDQVTALRTAGHEVLLASVSSDDLAGQQVKQAVRGAWNVVTGEGWDPTADLKGFGPDIVNVHNLFPNIGTKWLKQWSGAVVSTIHNYRPLCANGLLFRGGSVCTDCPDGKEWSSVKHACYRDSRLATLPLAIRNSRGLRANELIHRSNSVILLSERSRQIYLKYGLPTGSVSVIPNFVELEEEDRLELIEKELDDCRYWLYLGREGVGKGLATLIEEWPCDQNLELFGPGNSVRSSSHGATNLNFQRAAPRATVSRALSECVGLVYPSESWETFGLVVVEAFEAGVPVVARAGSAGADLVEEFQAGAVYGPGHISLREALDYVSSNQEVLRKRARAAYEQNFTKEIWLKRIEKLYESVIAEHKKSSG